MRPLPSPGMEDAQKNKSSPFLKFFFSLSLTVPLANFDFFNLLIFLSFFIIFFRFFWLSAPFIQSNVTSPAPRCQCYKTFCNVNYFFGIVSKSIGFYQTYTTLFESLRIRVIIFKAPTLCTNIQTRWYMFARVKHYRLCFSIISKSIRLYQTYTTLFEALRISAGANP